MRNPAVMVFSGLGINCEKELAHAFQQAGADVITLHIQAFLNNNIDLKDYSILCFPGGFSFADELGAGKVLANRLAHAAGDLKGKLLNFVEQGNAILGICNGFQLLVKLGLLPGNSTSQSVSLSHNDSSRFENRWVHHRVQPTNSIFLRDLSHLYLPIRHGEGKLVGEYDPKYIPLKYTTAAGMPTQSFPDNPNGSSNAAAALTDPTGRILGMMAHPEAALYFTQDPRWSNERQRLIRAGKEMPRFGDGYALFRNAVAYFKEQK